MNESHLEPDEMVAYRAGALTAADEKRVQDHLVACRECSRLLLDLEGLADPAFGADEPWSAADDEAVWERVRDGLRQERQPAAPVVPFPGGPTGRRPPPPRWLQALAAALLVAVLGLSFQVASLRRTVADLSRPQVNAPVLDLYPAGSERRGAEGGEAVEVPAGARLFTLMLNPGGRGGYPEYELEISTLRGELVRREGGLQPNEFGSFSVTLPRQTLTPGDYRLRLVGLGPAGARETLAGFALRLPPS